MVLENDVAKCEISKIETCDGEAVANNRKGKLIFFYEWDLTLSWKGHLSGAAKEIEGTINIPNLSEENTVAEIEVLPNANLVIGFVFIIVLLAILIICSYISIITS